MYPGRRLDFNGKPFELGEDGPDEEWFYGTHESYSDRNVDTKVWAPHLNQYAPRSAESYTLLKDPSTKKVD